MRSEKFSTSTLRVLATVAIIVVASLFTPSQDFRPSDVPIKSIGSLKAPAGWQRFQIGDPALLTIAFPTVPRGFKAPKSTDDEFILAAASETTVFTVSVAIDPARETKSDHGKWQDFNNSAAGFVDGMRKQGLVEPDEPPPATRDQRIKSASGIEGFQRDASFRQRRCRIQVFSIGRRLLILTTIATAASPDREQEAFFNSLSLEMARGSREEAALVSPLAEWKRFELENGIVSVTFPTEPQQRSRKLGAGSGWSEGLYYSSHTDNALYLVSYTQPPDNDFENPSASEVKMFYAAIWKSLEETVTERFAEELKSLKASPTSPLRLRGSSVRPASVGGLRGEEKEFQNDVLQIRIRLALANGRMFLVATFATIETPFATRDAFFKSVTFTTTATNRTAQAQ